MKKLSVLLLVLCVFFMTACASATPSEALKADMEDAKNNPEEIMGEIGEEGFGEEAMNALVNKLLEFEYELGEETINDDTATVETTITTYPFGDIFSTVMAQLLTEASSNPDITEEETNALIDKFLLEGLEKAEKDYTETATITLSKEAGIWVVQDDETMANALTGGIYNWTSNIDE